MGASDILASVVNGFAIAGIPIASILYGARFLRRRGYPRPLVSAIGFLGTVAAGVLAALSLAYFGWEPIGIVGSFLIFILGVPLAMVVVASVLPPPRHRASGPRVSRGPVDLIFYGAGAIFWGCAGLLVALHFAAGPDVVGMNDLENVGIPLLTAGAFLIASGYRAAAQMRAPRSLPAATEDDGRPPVLFLREFVVEERPFVRDSGREVRPYLKRAKKWIPLLPLVQWGNEQAVSVEDYLTGDIEQTLGPFVALGNPTDYLQPLGAAREYAEDLDWQERFLSLARQAQAILLVPGQSANLAWELATLLNHGLATKLFVIVGTETFPTTSFRFPRSSSEISKTPWETFRAQMEAAGYSLPVACPRERSVIGFDSAGRAELITDGGAISPAAYVHAVETHLIRLGHRQAVSDPSMDSILGDKVGRGIQESMVSLGVRGLDSQRSMVDEAFLLAGLLVFQAGIMLGSFDLVPAFTRFGPGFGWSLGGYYVLACLSGAVGGILLSAKGYRISLALIGGISGVGAVLSVTVGLTWLESSSKYLFGLFELMGCLPGLFAYYLLHRQRLLRW